MDRKEDREILRKGGFAEGEMKRLSQLRKDYNEKERLQSIADHRRMEFIPASFRSKLPPKMALYFRSVQPVHLCGCQCPTEVLVLLGEENAAE